MANRGEAARTRAATASAWPRPAARRRATTSGCSRISRSKCPATADALARYDAEVEEAEDPARRVRCVSLGARPEGARQADPQRGALPQGGARRGGPAAAGPEAGGEEGRQGGSEQARRRRGAGRPRA